MKFSYPEGATPLDDISGLKPNWVKTQADLNQVEGENILIAIGKYLLKPVGAAPTWFNVPTLKKIHRDMFSDVWIWAGKFRTTQTIPGMKPYQIAEALESLCQDVKFWCEQGCKLTILEQAAQIHHRLAFIHPYLNGNGRFSRLVADRYLKSWKYPLLKWPIDIDQSGPHRRDYITALQSADRGDYEPLVLYMMQCNTTELEFK